MRHRQANWTPKVGKGGDLGFSAWIENTGAAPMYRDYRLALRLVRDRAEAVLPLPVDIRAWLPGDAWIEESLPIPADLGSGDIRLYAGLVDPQTLRPRVRFAVEESDGRVGAGGNSDDSGFLNEFPLPSSQVALAIPVERPWFLKLTVKTNKTRR